MLVGGRTCTFALNPRGGLEQVASGAAENGLRQWHAARGPAQFDLLPDGDVIAAGWVLVEGKLIRHGPASAARLYFDMGQGFTEKQSIALSVSRRGTILELILLPKGVKALRWQALSSAGEFVQSPLRMREVGSVERTVRMVHRVLSTISAQSKARCEAAGLTLRRMVFDLQAAYAAAGKFRGYASISYPDWIRQFDALQERDRDQIRQHLSRFRRRPRFTIVVAVQNGAVDELAPCLKSLCEQLYRDSTIVAVDSGGALSSGRNLDTVLQTSNIRIVPAESVSEFLEELNRDCSQGNEGRFVAIIPANSILAEHALYWIAAELQRRPKAALLYSDDDRFDGDGVRKDPSFKPDWSPELLRSTNYLGGLAVYSARAIARIGGMRPEMFADGGHDLALRVTEVVSADEVVHVPAVLYHRRSYHADASAPPSGDVVRAHLSRRGVAGTVTEVCPGCFRVHYALREHPLVSVLIPTRDSVELLRRCVESVVHKTTYRNYELLVIDNQSRDTEAVAYLASLAERPNIRVLRYDPPFNFSAINNFAARHAQGKVLCLLNNDTEVISPDWMEEMVGHLVQERVGVVGAKLLYPDGRVQHAGDAVGPGGCADHMHSLIGRDDPGYCNRAILAQDLSAVTGACLMTWKSLYGQMGGLDEKHLQVAFNDVDYCLRVREAGYRVVWTPHAELFHDESVSRGRDASEQAKRLTRREADYMRSRWRHVMQHDPFYNANLSYERPDFSLSAVPMVRRPWVHAKPWWRRW